MNTIVNRKTSFSSKLLSPTVLSFLFAVAVLMHVVAQASYREHPVLSMLLAMLETLSWICILVINTTWLVKAIRYGFPPAWRMLRAFASTHLIKTAQKKEAYASLEQLKQLHNNIQRLGSVLYGCSPQMGMNRLTRFEVPGETVPFQSPQYEALEVEFKCLVNMLTHYGFPALESVRLQLRILAFIQQWGSDLETRLRNVQKQTYAEKDAVQSALSMAIMTHQHIGQTYPAAQSHLGYQQIHGALQILKELTHSEQCPWELIGERIPALNRGMNVVLKDLK